MILHTIFSLIKRHAIGMSCSRKIPLRKCGQNAVSSRLVDEKRRLKKHFVERDKKKQSTSADICRNRFRTHKNPSVRDAPMACRSIRENTVFSLNIEKFSIS